MYNSICDAINIILNKRLNLAVKQKLSIYLKMSISNKLSIDQLDLNGKRVLIRYLSVHIFENH
jgi:hypothetical protein